ncbi:hypothetical protein EDEG_01193 [Edhazardia aedis USNM 41457]|uniref:Uncharacterized protein n=1 Tax=Edhazardia aedis (strain USNM 41457) TaxID=1003232 RepID=J9DAV0_EDHAE|nr:hypothetical protein EDEG_01193 [Edhazardia aedis USNM 41457]|eukprot:EJW04609.1 hypothetical protein EDEG_01193 [Edhazardia aedis USNM 41457]
MMDKNNISYSFNYNTNTFNKNILVYYFRYKKITCEYNNCYFFPPSFLSLLLFLLLFLLLLGDFLAIKLIALLRRTLLQFFKESLHKLHLNLLGEYSSLYSTTNMLICYGKKLQFLI